MLGHKKWAIPGGNIPLQSTGREPEFLSQDRIAVLNTGTSDAEITLTVFYENKSPIGDYKIKIAARRLRKIRINDLIDPLPVPLEKAYSLILSSTQPVVVQFFRANTSSAKISISGTMAHGST